MCDKKSKYNVDSILAQIEQLTSKHFYISINNFMKDLESNNKSKLTIQTYLQDLLTSIRLFSQSKQISLDELPTDIASWRSLFKQRYSVVTPGTQNKFLSSQKAYANFLSRSGSTELAACLNRIQQAKTPSVNPKPIDLNYIKVLLDSQSDSWLDARDKALWMLLYGCGLRIQEALSLNIVSIMQCTDLFTVIGKGNKERTLPLLAPVKQALDIYIKNRPITEHELLFIDTKLLPLTRIQAANHLKKVTRKLGLPSYTTPHKLRHSFVSHLIEQKATLKAIQTLVGHSSLATIQNYASVSIKHLSYAHKQAAEKWEKHEEIIKKE